MACRLDVKKAAFDKAFEIAFDGRYTFSRLSDDTARINGRIDNAKTKALSKEQAYKIAKERLLEINKEFNGHVRGYINQNSSYDAITVTLDVNPAYIEHEYNKLPDKDKTDTDSLLFQLSGTEQRGFSSATLGKVNEFLERIGVDKKKVQDIVVNGKKQNANAVALMSKALIEYTNGNEEAITEEAMHFAVEILEQTNPSLFNRLLLQVGSTTSYKEVLDAYSSNTLYQKEGKPDIRKLKKEAIAKKLVDVILTKQNTDGEKTDNVFIDLWTKLVDWFRQIYSKAGFNPFEEAVNKVFNEDIGTVEDINPIKSGYTRLYRAENEVGLDSPAPDWLKEQPEIIAQAEAQGRWFYKSLEEARYHSDKFGSSGISYVDVPTEEVENYNARDNKFAGSYGKEGKEYFLPKDVAKNKKLLGSAYLQITEPTEIQKAFVNRIKSDPIVKGEDGYYVDGKKLPKRVTDFAKVVYERMFGDGDLGKSDYQKAVDEIKAESGTKGHADIEHIFSLFVDPATGIVRPQPLQDNYTPLTNKGIYDKLKENMQQRIATFESGTIFLTEAIVHDDKVGGTIDLLAMSPSGKVSILDWKFMDLNTDNYKDVPWYKKKAWRIQVGKYKSILNKNYGIKDSDFLKTEVVPIKAEYSYYREIDGNNYPKLSKITIGEPSLSSETRDYLLPVALETQSTGDKQLDKLIKKLVGLRGTIEDRSAKSPTEKVGKAEQLNSLERAVRHLQIRKSVEPLVEQASIYTKEIQNLFDYYNTHLKDKDFTTLDKEMLSDFGLKLDKAFDDINIYTNLDVELKYLFKGTLTPQQQTTYNKIRDIVRDTRSLLSELEDVTNAFGEKVANAYGAEDITRVEKQVSNVSRLFSATSKLQTKVLEVFYKMRREAQNLMDLTTNEENNKLLDTKRRYDVLAKANGWTVKNYFDIIKKKGSNQLIDQYDKEFYVQLKDRVAQKDYEWIQENVDIKAFKEKMAEEKAVREEYLKNKIYEGDINKIRLAKKKDKEQLNKDYDLSKPDSIGWYKHRKLMRQFPVKEKWTTAEWTTLHSKGNEAALELYNWIIETNKKAAQTGYISNRDFGKTERLFLPYVPKTFTETLVWGGNVSLMDQFIRNMTIDETSVGYGQIDPVTGKLVNKIPKYFVAGDDIELSEDLFKNLALYNESLNRYKQLSDIEGIALALGRVEKNKQSIVTSFWGKPKYDSLTESFEVIDNNDKNAELYDKQVATLVYGQKYVDSEKFDQLLGKVGTVFEKMNKVIGKDVFPTNLEDRQLSMNKSIDTLNNFFQQKTLGLNPLPSITNFLGGNFNAIINSGSFFTKEDFIKSEFEITTNLLRGEEGKKFLAALDYFQPYTDDTNRDLVKDLSITRFSNTSIQDALFWMMRKGDRVVQSSIFLANLRNQVVIDGKIVNAREYIRKNGEYANRYSNPTSLKEAEEKYNKEVEDLINQKGLMKMAELKDGKLVISGIDRISDETFGVRNVTRELTKKALGNLSPEEVRGVQQNVYLRSMMVFKNWVPNLVDVRFGELKYNSALDAYEWGRARTLARYMSLNGIKSLMNLRSVLRADEEGIKLLNELYEYKKRTYKEDTGRDLEMSEADFYDMVRQNISSMAKDALITLSVITMFVIASQMTPDDDDEYGKNLHKFTIKALDKAKDELFFFYNPASLESVLNGSIFPSLGVLSEAINVLNHFTKEIYGFAFDEELQEKNYVVKYLLKTFPVASQLTSYMPLYAPELAKELGIKMSTQSRLK